MRNFYCHFCMKTMPHIPLIGKRWKGSRCGRIKNDVSVN